MMDRRSALGMILGIALPPGLAFAAPEPLKIAFVDTGNTGRSLMAEVLARDLAMRRRLHVAVISRGLDVDPFDEAPEVNAAILMTDRGFNVAAHRARALATADVTHADLLLTMTTPHRERLVAAYPLAGVKTFTLAHYAADAADDIPDAWGKPMADYRAVLRQLDLYLPLALAKAAARRP